MNIKQAEEASGIQKSNLRLYEKEGLVVPKRNKENDYREYSEEDIQKLKMIRMLRMIAMPLEQIKDIINGKISMKEAGVSTDAKAIVFSLPVTDTAGMRLLDELEMSEELGIIH